LVQLGAKTIKFPNNEMLCSPWVDGYSLSNALAQSTAIGISVLNGIIVGVLVTLSSFQRFLNKTEEKASSIVKMFLV
jgi:hypothetical protein